MVSFNFKANIQQKRNLKQNKLCISNAKKIFYVNSREKAQDLLTFAFDQRIKTLYLGHLYHADHVHDIVLNYEKYLYAHFARNYDKYKNRVAAICANILDKDNKTFFFKLIKQQIEPKKLALISIQDMASDAQQMMRSERFAAELASIEQDALHSQKNSNIHIKKTHKGEEEIQVEM